jgi:hypothetical protein
MVMASAPANGSGVYRRVLGSRILGDEIVWAVNRAKTLKVLTPMWESFRNHVVHPFNWD